MQREAYRENNIFITCASVTSTLNHPYGSLHVRVRDRGREPEERLHSEPDRWVEC